MADLNAYLAIPYVDGGRDRAGADCWGLVRIIAHELFGLPLFPLYASVLPGKLQRITAEHNALSADFIQIVDRPQPGDLFAVYLGGWCAHVGICVRADGRLKVLHSQRKSGPQLTPLHVLALRYSNFKWWRYGAA